MDLLRDGEREEERELVTGREHDEERQPGKNKQVTFNGGNASPTLSYLIPNSFMEHVCSLTHYLPFFKRFKEDKIRLTVLIKSTEPENCG